MTDPDLPADDLHAADLLGDVQWTERLARRLVGDPHVAADVAQEGWLAALRQPFQARSRRAWMTAVVRNAALAEKRKASARAVREERSARGEALPSAAETLERAEVQHRVVAAVLSLDEPYRTTLLWRWFDGLAPEEIASKQGVPASTVRTRLRRGHERLRGVLDAEYGGREQWGTLFLPVVTWRMVMATKSMQVTAAAVVALAISATLWIAASSPETERASEGVGDEHALVAPSADGGQEPEVPQAPVENVQREDVTAAAIAPVLESARTWRLRIVDAHTREPIGGAEMQGFAEPVLSDSAGRIELSKAPKVGMIHRADYSWLFWYPPEEPPADEIEIALPGRGVLEVLVFDEGGEPLPGRRITAVTHFGYMRPNGESATFKHDYGRTDENGRLLIDPMPCTFELTVSVQGEDVRESVVIDAGTKRGRVQLTVPGLGKITGRVVRPGGEPAGDVEIEWSRYSDWDSLHDLDTRTSPEGLFELNVPTGVGFVSVYDELFEPVAIDVERGAEHDLGTLELGGAVSVSGRVVVSGTSRLRGLYVSFHRAGEALESDFTDEDGSFEVSLAPGPVEVRVSRGGELARFEAIAPSTGLELSLDGRVGGLRGELPGAAEGLVLELYEPGQLTVGPLGAYPQRVLRLSGVTVEEERFQCLALPTGTFDVELTSGETRVLVHEVELTSAEVVDLGRLAVGPAHLSGIVFTPDAAPADGAELRLVRERETLYTATCDSEGRFELTGLEPGMYLLRGGTPRLGRLADRALSLAAGEARELELRLDVPGRLHGRVTRDGRPVARMEIFGQEKGKNHYFQTTSDADGFYAFEDMPPMNFVLRCGGVSRTVTIGAGEVELPLPLEEMGMNVLVLRDGEPVEGVTDALLVELGAGATPRYFDVTIIDNRTLRTALPAGTWSLRFTVEHGEAMGEYMVPYSPSRDDERDAHVLELPAGRVEVESAVAPTIDVLALPGGSAPPHEFYDRPQRIGAREVRPGSWELNCLAPGTVLRIDDGEDVREVRVREE